VGRRSDGAGVWGWIAGIVVIALIAIFLIAGSKNVNNTTSNTSSPPASTTGMSGTPRGPAPSTTGMGSPSQFPAPPANPNTK